MGKIILYISELADMGGGEQILLSWIKGLDRKNFQPAVLCSCEGPLPEKLRAMGVPVTIFPFGGIGRLAGFLPFISLCGVLRFLKLFQSMRPVLIHSNCFSGLIFSALPARILGIPLLWSDHGWAYGGGMQGKFINSFTAGVTAVSETVRGFLLGGGSIAPGKVTVVYPGVDTVRFRKSGESIEVRKEFSIPPGAFTVGLVGRLQEVKGHRLFLQAAAEIKKKYPDARFLIIGARLFDRRADDGYEADLAAWIKEFGLEANVIMTGHREDMPKLFSCLDVMICASRRESFCLAAAEALSCETPLVSTKCGGPEEIIENGVSGLLVPPGNSQAMAAAALRLLENRAEAAAMGRAGRARVAERFSPASASGRLRHIYGALLEKA
jgi:glycosyltransferase involved in cell wall biosynthesis